MAVSRFLRSLPVALGACALAGAATLAQVALASPPLEWPTGPGWLAEPRNLFVITTGLLAGLGALAAAVQILSPTLATRRQVRGVGEGVAQVSRQVRAQALDSESRDAETHRKLSALPEEVSARLLPELKKIAESNPMSQLKDVEVTISIKASFFESNGSIEVKSGDGSPENNCGK